MPRPQNPPKYDPPRYASPSSNVIMQQQQQQRSSAPFIKTYMKPLPKLPPEIGMLFIFHLILCQQIIFKFLSKKKKKITEESRELSSTDDLSSRAHSPSVSSSDESYSKTTEGECEEENSPIPIHHIAKNSNPLQWLYPCDIQVDLTSPKLSPVDFSNLKDFEISSTTESQAPSTTAQNRGGESCNSFEYHDRGGGGGNGGAGGGVAVAQKSPFEREIQRLLDSSARANNKELHIGNGGINSNGGGMANVGYHDKASNLNSCRNNIDILYNNSNSSSKLINNNKSKYELECIEKLPTKLNQQQINNQIILGKHPVGLEAIKEITRNTNPSDSSQM